MPENSKVLFICAVCRRKLRAGLRIDALEGDTAPVKEKCDFCRRVVYGDWVKVSYATMKEPAHA